ncbi:addiction module protein [Corallococcus aberystwythensis]|uniref:Addiction module protein n=2 Tax=Corallococcus aberystwythensis TaxID=2316722 RepID=A0A3A8QYF9_9BACT|nr:addiction module protein [Corallococcus aberystwythensis]
MATRDELLAQALRLSPDDRARLAHELLDSLDGDVEAPDAEAAWGEEISRRAQEVLDGTVELVEWDEVRKQMNEELERMRR